MSKRKRNDSIFYDEDRPKKKYQKVDSSKEEYLKFYIDNYMTLEEKEAKERRHKREKKENEFIKKKTEMCLIKCIQKLDIDSGLKINRYNESITRSEAASFKFSFPRTLWLSNEDYMSVELTNKGKYEFVNELIRISKLIVDNLTSKCSLFYNTLQILVLNGEDIIEILIMFQPNELFKVIPDIPKMLMIDTATRYSILGNDLKLFYNCKQKYEDVSECEVFLDYLFIGTQNFIKWVIKFLVLIKHTRIGFILDNIKIDDNNNNNNNPSDPFYFRNKRCIRRIKPNHVVIFDEKNFKDLLEEEVTLDLIQKFRFLETTKHYYKMESFMNVFFNHININGIKDDYKCLTTLNEKIKMIGKIEKIK